MNKIARLLAAAAALALLGQGAAFAASSATVNIDVTIQANLSVEVSAAASSTQTVAWNTAFPGGTVASASTATVRNDSGGLTERWALSTNANSINTAGGSDVWTIVSSSDSVGADQIAIQAVFGSSMTAAGGCPAAASTDWNRSYAPPLTTSPVQYTSAVFADPNLNNDGTPNPDITAGGADGRMFADSKRALCWRLVLPSMTSTVQTQNVQITVTAVVP